MALISSETKATTIVEMIDDREKQLGAVKARLAAMKAAPEVLALETRRMEREARKWIADLKAVLGAEPEKTKLALAELLDGRRLTFAPTKVSGVGPRFAISGEIATGALSLSWASPAGLIDCGQRELPDIALEFVA